MLDPHRLAEARSLAYRTWQLEGIVPEYARQWETVLSLPVDALRLAMLDETEAGCAILGQFPEATGDLVVSAHADVFPNHPAGSTATLLERLPTMGLDGAQAATLAGRVSGEFQQMRR
jgi:hypothetical protein